MPPLAKYAATILDDSKCWGSLASAVTQEEASEICAWNGWHPIIRAQLEMFLGLRALVPGHELRIQESAGTTPTEA
jgi:hypothetical protein